MKQFLSLFHEGSVTPQESRLTLGILCEMFGLLAVLVAGLYLLSTALS